jgi:hypothetical protein
MMHPKAMDQVKFALGPYEIFSSTVGGSPLVLALLLICNPSSNLQNLFLLVKNDLSIPGAVLIVFFSYILGGSLQGITWKYFLFLCNLFHQEYSYFGGMIAGTPLQQAPLPQASDLAAALDLEFEDKLVLLLREKVGIPKNLDWLNARLTAYLKERGSPAVITAESYLANHIMYRNMSFGFLLLPVVLIVNLLRTQVFAIEQPLLILLCIAISYMTFLRSLSFKKWHSRELVLGFYFSASHGATNSEP